jgi:hypothetical protein
MSKLEQQKALPRRRPYRDINTANEALMVADKSKRKPKYQAKKAKKR